MRWCTGFLFVAPMLVASCTGSDEVDRSDAGRDAEVDGSRDARPGGRDAGPDGGGDAALDGGDDGDPADAGMTPMDGGASLECDGHTPAGFSAGGSAHVRTASGADGERVEEFDPFPGVDGTKLNIVIPSERYLVIPFTAPEAGRNGSMFFTADSIPGSGAALINISRCPGDFRNTTGPDCRVESLAHGSYYWDTVGSDYTCSLEPGEDYYFNMAFAEGVGNDLTDTCHRFADDGMCGLLMQWDNP